MTVPLTGQMEGVVDVLLAIPSLLLSLTVIILLGFGTLNAAVAVGDHGQRLGQIVGQAVHQGGGGRRGRRICGPRVPRTCCPRSAHP